MAVILKPVYDPNNPPDPDAYFDQPPPKDSIGTYDLTSPYVVRAMQPELFEQMRQFEVARRNLQPYVDVGPAALEQLRGADTAQGFDQRLGQIFGTDTFQRLQAERMRTVKNQLNQSGMMRSDAALRELADVPLDVGLALEEQLFNRSAGFAGNAQNAAAGLGGLGAQNANSISQILMQRQADRTARANMNQQRNAQMVSTAAQIGMFAMMFSDRRLKTNLQAVGRLGPLTWYRWDWVSGVPASGQGQGVIAQEVMQIYPEHVYPVGPYLAVDYAGLMAATGQRTPLVEVAA